MGIRCADAEKGNKRQRCRKLNWQYMAKIQGIGEWVPNPIYRKNLEILLKIY